MFQRSHFRSELSTITSSNNEKDHKQSKTERRHQLSNRWASSAITNHASATSKITNNNSSLPNQQQQQLITLQSSLRRIVIAIATWRSLTSTSTSTVTTTTTAGCSLSALLKSLLVGCYYIIAFTSLLMLILYINNHVATQNNSSPNSNNIINNHHNKNNNRIHAQEKPAAIISLSASKMTVMIETNSSSNLNYPIHTNMLRTKRSTHANHAGLDPSNKQQHKQINVAERRVLEGKTSSTRINQRIKAFFRSNSSFGSAAVGRRSDLDPVSVQTPHTPTLKVHESSRRRPPLFVRTTATPNQAQATTKQPTTTISAIRTLPELTERLASYSVNNRGIMGNSNSNNNSSSSGSINTHNVVTKPIQSNESQWIPILGRQESRRVQTYAHDNAGMSMSRDHAHRPPPVGVQNQQRQQEPAMMSPTTVVDIIDNNNNNYHHTEGHQQVRHRYHHYHAGLPHHHHHQIVGPYLSAPSYPNRQWRRPRLNIGEGGLRPSKMYKRVLLCDKTLVSLDYIRNLDSEPRVHPGHFGHSGFEHNNDFDDNVIDLDSNLDTILADRRSNTNETALNSIVVVAESSSSPPAHLTDIRDDLILENSSIEGERRLSYLADEDPLVKCDMWDLEKGLKNRKPPPEILRMAIRADFDTVRDAINRCRQLSEKTLPPDDEFRDGIEIMSTEDLVSLFSFKRGLIPGTKWCGLGDQASSYNDLGPKHRIDICCRAHDHCPIRLKPFRNDYGVINIALYTKSHCDCDADFYRCLREVHSRTADMLGNLYFNVMKLQCMREERMKICREVKPIALGFERCIRYEESPVKTVFRFTTPPVAY